MATSQELADHALTLARAFLAAHHGELAALADYHPETLITAAGIMQAAPGAAAEAGRGPEHIAYTLLAVAFTELTRLSRETA